MALGGVRLKHCKHMDDSVKYGLVLPIIKTIASVGGKHNALGERNYIEIFKDRNAGSSYDSLCQLVRNFGVYKMNWIIARCDPTHRDYTDDSSVVRKWQIGVRYEVALVL